MPTELAPCPCGPSLWRPVLCRRRWNGEPQVDGCLGCGRVRLTRAVMTSHDPRSGWEPEGWRHEQLPAPLRDWIAAWPRMAEDGEAYLRATARCGDEAGLRKLEAERRAAAAGRNRLQLLVDAGCPTDPPPAPLPDDLAAFGFVSWLLRTSDAQVATLLAAASPAVPGAGSAAAPLAEHVVRRQAWAEDLTARIGSGGEVRAGALREIAAAPPGADIPRGLDPVVAALAGPEAAAALARLRG